MVRGAAIGALATVCLLPAAFCHPLFAQSTRAERTNYTETSSHSDVLAFLDSLERIAPNAWVRGTIGTSANGRALPYLVVSRPLVRTPEAARASGKPIVYVQGNIHGGEVEGKEALQALLRDLIRERKANVLDSLVLIVVPIYNADGNDSLGAQERNRGAQNGPERIGLRPNGQGFDLNRDYVKAEAPETRGSLAMFATWQPDAFMDLHTTNGSYHGYALTYSPSLHPAAMVGALAPAGPWTRDTLLPELRRRVRERRGDETFDYGNFRGEFMGRDDPTSLQKGGWESYEHKPRYGTNYAGLRNMVAVLSEAYSHDPLQRRVEATDHFVREFLSLIAERRTTVLARTRGVTPARPGTAVPIRGALTATPFTAPILVEPLERIADSTERTEPGLPRGLRRTHRFVAVTMPVWDRFDGTLTRALPQAWVIDTTNAAVMERLRLHGVQMVTLRQDEHVDAESFVVDSIIRPARAFQGHQETRLEGRWVVGEEHLSAGTVVVPANQPLGVLAAVLLEPQSDDGLGTWNFFDASLAVGKAHPVIRVLSPVTLPPSSRR